jgi:hypothetical protein
VKLHLLYGDVREQKGDGQIFPDQRAKLFQPEVEQAVFHQHKHVASDNDCDFDDKETRLKL